MNNVKYYRHGPDGQVEVAVVRIQQSRAQWRHRGLRCVRLADKGMDGNGWTRTRLQPLNLRPKAAALAVHQALA